MTTAVQSMKVSVPWDEVRSPLSLLTDIVIKTALVVLAALGAVWAIHMYLPVIAAQILIPIVALSVPFFLSQFFAASNDRVNVSFDKAYPNAPCGIVWGPENNRGIAAALQLLLSDPEICDWFIKAPDLRLSATNVADPYLAVNSSDLGVLYTMRDFCKRYEFARGQNTRTVYGGIHGIRQRMAGLIQNLRVPVDPVHFMRCLVTMAMPNVKVETTSSIPFGPNKIAGFYRLESGEDMQAKLNEPSEYFGKVKSGFPKIWIDRIDLSPTTVYDRLSLETEEGTKSYQLDGFILANTTYTRAVGLKNREIWYRSAGESVSVASLEEVEWAKPRGSLFQYKLV